MILDFIIKIGGEFWSVLGEMSPYLLFGFFVAGILSILVSQKTVEKHLGGSGFKPILKSALFGIPLPLCSCGVIPVAASLRNSGANRSSTTAFLLSTPQTGVDSIMVTLSLLGPVFAIFRPLAALATGLLGGISVELLDKDKHQHLHSDRNNYDSANKSIVQRLKQMLQYGFITLPQDIAKPLIVGLVIAAAISVIIPANWLSGVLGGGIIAMIVMTIFGVPIYVCATASVPIAAVFIAKGVSPGAALVFLMTGPATNAAAITTLWKILGKKTAIIYLTTVVVSAISAGLLLDYIFNVQQVSLGAVSQKMLPGYLKTISAVGLLAVLAHSIYRMYRSSNEKRKNIHKLAELNMQQITLSIKGMTCSHCAFNVQKALSECDGVESAEVSLKDGVAVVAGEHIDSERLRESVENAGYSVTGITNNV